MSELSLFDATMIAEGVQEADVETRRKAWQMLVDTGVCWKLQGWFGHSAVALLTAGEIVASTEQAKAVTRRHCEHYNIPLPEGL